MLGPNMTGQVTQMMVRSTSTQTYNGIVSSVEVEQGSVYGTSGALGGQASKINFNANNSNSIYTDSGKVYPLSLALNFIIKS